jgi:hypothetical protein
MTGTVNILNVGEGDIKLSFDKANPAEVIRASRIVTDMLKRGYALLVAVPPTPGNEFAKPVYTRVHGFDQNTNEYIIADFDPSVAQETNTDEETNQEDEALSSSSQEATEGATPARKSRRRPPKVTTTRIAASTTSAIAVPRTAGG